MGPGVHYLHMHKILWNRPVNVSMDNLSHIARNSIEVVYINFNDRSGLLLTQHTVATAAAKEEHSHKLTAVKPTHSTITPPPQQISQPVQSETGL